MFGASHGRSVTLVRRPRVPGAVLVEVGLASGGAAAVRQAGRGGEARWWAAMSVSWACRGNSAGRAACLGGRDDLRGVVHQGTGDTVHVHGSRRGCRR
jgi:hypothetical protein